MNISVGRFGANAVRAILQKVLITGKPRTDVRFVREIRFGADDIAIADTIDASAAPSKLTFSDLSVASDATSIYVANSNVFQESVLMPWTDIDPADVANLNQTRRVALPERRIRGRRKDQA